MPVPSAKQAVDFFTLLQRLKVTKRTGWIRKQVDSPESIADHMYRMSMMAFVGANKNIDVNKCVKMALVHDVAESIVGDITPFDGVSKAEKQELETSAMQKIQNMLGSNTQAAQEIVGLWSEYEAASTPEAQFVKDLDKLEMILQALEYEAQQGKDLQEFFESTKNKFKTETGKAWAEEVISRRLAALQQNKSNSTNDGS